MIDTYVFCPCCKGSFRGLGNHMMRMHPKEFTVWLKDLKYLGDL